MPTDLSRVPAHPRDEGGEGAGGGDLLLGDKALLVRQASSSHNLWVCV